ncbi:MAG: methyltransferase domain-containing protein [Candidatus Jettenia sp.]|uniref:Arsenite methyltransferase n=1 Tax=Candidatus Jettenia caeni TaxID=247490 RepID=I3IHX9_9BACT|nr:methyltransferase domain-containing protein [Candidatus Jettenia sp. AMX1]MBC6930004.1 methyltransferase domain-containing protein [Candidatus Jettenia sp.]GAB61324.1 putative methyltransferase [Candidatus Jettenia caeni]KAA0248396.1 MAG: methyltransferase domain-containing protein [Candidatus Jettenia sp. AMX1]MCE7881625.1 methyltransferase domain-containing protein [Candidatus Jettenia sp. AMX1]MCQ3928284.1 methyltransferase domain-containing protein [Candidatus Jettenia sp.]
MITEQAVRERYSAAAAQKEASLCCPVTYNPKYLEVIPKEVLDRDYGCGDPSKYLTGGETVLDLGSGGGKICFIASQVVGSSGRVIGVDMNDEMLVLARKANIEVSKCLGYGNVEFRKGKIQDLRIDRDLLDAWLKQNPVRNEADLSAFESYVQHMSVASPMIPDESIDTVISNCVLNLVNHKDKPFLFKEIYRVLKRGGRAAISDIVSDAPIPIELQQDTNLWSGCVSGALQEYEFLRAFEDAGFYGITIDKRDERPWRTVKGIEFRSITVLAYKGKEGPCWDHKEAVVYKGPFRNVTDDDGHEYPRGVRIAVCRKTFRILEQEPYANHFEFIRPREEVSAEKAQPFPCTNEIIARSPHETKGDKYTTANEDTTSCCDPGSCC